MSNTIADVYEKYKHLDSFLIDAEWLGDTALHQALYDMWQAIREHVERQQDAQPLSNVALGPAARVQP